MAGGLISGAVGRVSGASAVWTVWRDHDAVLRSLALSFEMMVRGGITIKTPDTDAALIATTFQLDGDIVVALSANFAAVATEARDMIAVEHASSVRATLAPLARLPEALRAANTVLFGMVAAANLGALAVTWGSTSMLGLVGTGAVSVLGRRPLKAGFRWLLRHGLRQRLDQVMMEFQAASAAEYHKLAKR
jgi:hypothetical protein